MSNAKHATTESGRKSHAEAAHNRARKIQESLPSQQVDFAQSETPFVVTDEDLMGEDISSLFGEAGLSASAFDDESPIKSMSGTHQDEDRIDDIDDIPSLFDEAVPFNETLSWSSEPALGDETTPVEANQESGFGAFAGEADDDASVTETDFPQDEGVKESREEDATEEDAPEDELSEGDSSELLQQDAGVEASFDLPSQSDGLDEREDSEEPSRFERDSNSSEDAYEAYQAEDLKKRLPIIIGVVIAAIVVVAAVVFVLGSRGVFGGGSNENTNSTVNVAVNENANNATNTENASTSASNATNVNANVNANAAEQATYEYTKSIPVVSQYPTFYGGCEVVALEMFLRAFGYDVSATTLADHYLEYGSSYVTTYSGDPYVSGAGYPPVMVKCAMSYLASVGSNAEVIGFKDEPFDKVVSYVKRGIPVVVWTTISCADPQLTGITVDGYEWYENEHNVVVYGVDNDYVYVVDPVDGYTRRDRAKFESVYAACGAMGYTMNI